MKIICFFIAFFWMIDVSAQDRIIRQKKVWNEVDLGKEMSAKNPYAPAPTIFHLGLRAAWENSSLTVYHKFDDNWLEDLSLKQKKRLQKDSQGLKYGTSADTLSKKQIKQQLKRLLKGQDEITEVIIKECWIKEGKEIHRQLLAIAPMIDQKGKNNVTVMSHTPYWFIYPNMKTLAIQEAESFDQFRSDYFDIWEQKLWLMQAWQKQEQKDYTIYTFRIRIEDWQKVKTMQGEWSIEQDLWSY